MGGAFCVSILSYIEVSERTTSKSEVVYLFNLVVVLLLGSCRISLLFALRARCYGILPAGLTQLSRSTAYTKQRDLQSRKLTWFPSYFPIK